MQHHIQLGKTVLERQKVLFRLIHQGVIQMGGNKKDKIYGLLSCNAGKKMKPENRVFFANEQEALNYGYRPCGACLRKKYLQWKSDQSNKFK
ncbi:Ada metal-binding domain-containing protein [Chitinophaga sp. Hz27]|uniref:Ada metal-binding domain-containing protein n=1 Tax=Chitinophaga sp. Hz27 TaxID=3347169 RepID=UPI0035DCD562